MDVIDLHALCDNLKAQIPITEDKLAWVTTREIAEKAGVTVSQANRGMVLLREDANSGVRGEKRGHGVRAPWYYGRTR